MSKIKCVLLVDDDQITNYMNLRLIKGLGVAERIEVALNGREALGYLMGSAQRDFQPDLIFLDINMPVMDGFEFLEEFHRMRASLTKVPVICMLTTSTYPADERRLRELQVDMAINKPLTAKSIKDAVARMNLIEGDDAPARPQGDQINSLAKDASGAREKAPSSQDSSHLASTSTSTAPISRVDGEQPIGTDFNKATGTDDTDHPILTDNSHSDKNGMGSGNGHSTH